METPETNTENAEETGQDEPETIFSENEKDALQRSWTLLMKDDTMLENCSYMFFNFFAKYPDLAKLFSFNTPLVVTPLNYKENREFCSFVRKMFLETIGSYIQKLDKISEMEHALENLGSDHYYFGLKKEDLDKMCDSLLYAIRRTLGSKFDEEIKKAWIHFYSHLTEIMKKGLEDKRKTEYVNA